MAQLVEQLLPIPEVRSSSPVIGKHLCWTFTVNCTEKTKIKKKRPGMTLLKNILERQLAEFFSFTKMYLFKLRSLSAGIQKLTLLFSCWHFKSLSMH